MISFWKVNYNGVILKHPNERSRPRRIPMLYQTFWIIFSDQNGNDSNEAQRKLKIIEELYNKLKKNIEPKLPVYFPRSAHFRLNSWFFSHRAEMGVKMTSTPLLYFKSALKLRLKKILSHQNDICVFFMGRHISSSDICKFLKKNHKLINLPA